MGIRGLASRIHGRFLSALDPSTVVGSKILIDGPNLVKLLSSRLPQNVTSPRYNAYVSALNKSIDALLSLKPESITFYFDGGTPEDKTATRIARKQSSLRAPPAPIYLVDTFACMHLQRFRKDVNVKLVAGEAEDAIVSDLVAAGKNASGQESKKIFVVSDDSDFFRYDPIPQSPQVHVLPPSVCNFTTDRSLKLSSVQLTPAIAGAVGPPDILEAREVDLACQYPQYQMDKVQDFLNDVSQHKSYTIVLLPFPEDWSMPPCWLVGQTWRSYAYSVLIQRHGSEDAKGLETVKEAYRIDAKYGKTEIPLLRDDKAMAEYKAKIEPIIENADTLIDAIIDEIITRPGPAYKESRDSVVCRGIKNHLRATFGLIEYPEAATKPRGVRPLTFQTHAQILAAIYSIAFLECTLQQEILPDKLFIASFLRTNPSLLQYWINEARSAASTDITNELEKLRI